MGWKAADKNISTSWKLFELGVACGTYTELLLILIPAQCGGAADTSHCIVALTPTM